MTIEGRHVTDQNFTGSGWRSPNGRFFLATGNEDGSFRRSIMILYLDGTLQWRADVEADANEGAVSDTGLSILSFSRRDARGGTIAVIAATGKLIANKNLEGYATMPAIASAVAAWRTIEDGITVARVHPWKVLAHHECDDVPEKIEIVEARREVRVVLSAQPDETFRF